MARPKVSTEFRSRFSEKLMDLGNFIAIAMVFGQFAAGKEFSFIMFGIGLILMILCYMVSYIIST